MKIIHINKIIDYLNISDSESLANEYARKYKAEIDKEINYALNDSQVIAEISIQLLGEEVPNGCIFYDKITELQHYLGYEQHCYEFAASIIINSFEHLQTKQIEELLLTALNKEVDTWSIVSILPFVFKKIDIEPEFAYSFFKTLSKTIDNDYAIQKTIEEYCYNYPELGIILLKKYLSDTVIDIDTASVILGVIRLKLQETNTEISEFNILDGDLANNMCRISHRRVFNLSWLIFCWKSSINIDKLDVLLSDMLNSKIDDHVQDACNLLYTYVRCNAENNSNLDYALEWLQKNISIISNPKAKYYIILLITNMCEQTKYAKTEYFNLYNEVQFSEDELKSTWSNLVYSLVHILESNRIAFEQLFKQLILKSSKALIFAFDSFNYLIAKMHKLNFSEFVASLLFSLNHRERKVGILLFKKLNNIDFNDINFETLTNIQLKAVILEFIINPFLAEETERFFRILEPIYGQQEQEIKDFFTNEMLFQAINYSGACLNKWKEMQNTSETYKKIVNDAEDYFKKINEIKDSPMKSFSFPTFWRAAIDGSKKFAINVQKEAYDKSVFTKLAKQTYLIYGDKPCHYLNETISEPSPMAHLEHSVEFPRLEEIDPEGLKIKRLESLAQLNKINRGEY